MFAPWTMGLHCLVQINQRPKSIQQRRQTHACSSNTLDCLGPDMNNMQTLSDETDFPNDSHPQSNQIDQILELNAFNPFASMSSPFKLRKNRTNSVI